MIWVKEFAKLLLAPIGILALILGGIFGTAYGVYVLENKIANSIEPTYAQQIITVGDIKWLCLTNHDKPVSCQLISPLTDDKLNNYKHINVQG